MSTPEISPLLPPSSSKRSVLIRLMGYPEDRAVQFNTEDLEPLPDWNQVLDRLESNPDEASIEQDNRYPIDHAIWIEDNPVEVDVIIRLLRVFPDGFTRQTYEIACDNPNTKPEVMRILRAADLNGDIVEERTQLVKLMGYPPYKRDCNYEQADIRPDWDGVRERLMTHPDEAKIVEWDWFPLADALWIENDPLPIDILVRLIRVFPDGFTRQTFEIACGNPNTRPEVMRILHEADLNGYIVEQRTQLVQLMGYPPYKWECDYEQEDIIPDWNGVRERLMTHPDEAKIDDCGCFPLADALWIENDPVPIDIVDSLIKIHPGGLTDQTFQIACSAKIRAEIPEILRLMFNHVNGLIKDQAFANSSHAKKLSKVVRVMKRNQSNDEEESHYVKVVTE